jgi:hypothetical protein
VLPHQVMPPGRWRAAVCDHDDAQIGVVEISL